MVEFIEPPTWQELKKENALLHKKVDELEEKIRLLGDLKMRILVCLNANDADRVEIQEEWNKILTSKTKKVKGEKK